MSLFAVLVATMASRSRITFIHTKRMILNFRHHRNHAVDIILSSPLQLGDRRITGAQGVRRSKVSPKPRSLRHLRWCQLCRPQKWHPWEQLSMQPCGTWRSYKDPPKMLRSASTSHLTTSHNISQRHFQRIHWNQNALGLLEHRCPNIGKMATRGPNCTHCSSKASLEHNKKSCMFDLEIGLSAL